MAESGEAVTPGATGTAVVDAFPTHNLGKPELRDMPAEPKPYWRLIGPGIVAAGGLLILINRKSLPGPIKVGGVRLAMLIWAILLFGTLSALTFRDQIGRLFGGG
jgi:hypothetical protein